MPHPQNDGGPAFPRMGEGFGNPLYDAPGMSLRDWFAGMTIVGHLDVLFDREASWEEIAEWAFDLADAMLAEREKRNGPH